MNCPKCLSEAVQSEIFATYKWTPVKGNPSWSLLHSMLGSLKFYRSGRGSGSSERKPSAPQFSNKMTRTAFWVDGCSTASWVKAKLKLTPKGSLLSRASYATREWSQDTAQGNGTTSQAIAMLKDGLHRGISINSYGYRKALQLCLKQQDFLATKQVHESILDSGMDKDPYVATTLLNVYIKFGRLLEGRRVFDEIQKKNVITWNMMITGYAKSDRAESALDIFNSMRQEGVQPNDVTYLCILKACANPSALKWGKEIHACIQHAGFESDMRVATALLQMYAKCGCIMEARQVFNRMEKRDVFTWNLMIGGLAQDGHGDEAYRLFLQMKREGFQPNAYTYAGIFNASASAAVLHWVTDVHDHARKAGLESDLRVGNALIHMYAKSGSINDARSVFDKMEKRDVFTWNILIGGLAQYGYRREAYQLFYQMRREGSEPDVVTYTSILNVSASADDLQWVTGVHCHARKAGLESDLRVGNALVHIYAKSGSIDEARSVFDRMEKRDVVTWTVMIGGLAEHGCGHEAYQLFCQMRREGLEPDVVTWTVMIGGLAQHGYGYKAYELFCQMRREGFEPDAATYLSILNASASAGALQWVRHVHGHGRRAGMESDLRVGNALVHMYAKSGSIDDARAVFDRMEKRDVVTWNVMIGGLAQHGCGREALEYFSEMNADGVKADQTTFTAVLSACCHSGLLDDGRRHFLAMIQDYGIEPSIEHYSCMVDLLARAGLLEESKLLIDEMPLEPNAITWRTLLGACRTYCNVELGEIVAKELFKLEPNEASTYVLLSNIYAAAGKRDKQESVRSMMEERGIRKEPGRSWIEVDKKIHEFVVGDLSHPEANAIYTMLKKLTENLKAEGYSPDIRLVLKDIDEADKESALCSHSEKLAIAYGLMRIPWGEPVRVFKNLRVCSDCHAASKLISKVIRRKIILRDANRFHHFIDGVCSCGDFW